HDRRGAARAGRQAGAGRRVPDARGGETGDSGGTLRGRGRRGRAWTGDAARRRMEPLAPEVPGPRARSAGGARASPGRSRAEAVRRGPPALPGGRGREPRRRAPPVGPGSGPGRQGPADGAAEEVADETALSPRPTIEPLPEPTSLSRTCQSGPPRATCADGVDPRRADCILGINV